MKYLFVSLILLLSFSASAQDAVFTQYNAAPLSLNPAMTGVFDGSVRIAGNYRNQWSQIFSENSYRTHSLSIDKKIKAGAKNYFGVGLLGVTDIVGELRLGTTQGKLSFSYMHTIGQSEKETHYLIIGQDFGVAQRHIDLTKARWANQFVNGVFDPTIPPPIPDFELEIAYFDMTTGVMWVSDFKGHNSLFGGLAVHHVNKPNASFLNRQEPLSRRLTLHVGGEFGFNDKWSIVPSFLYAKQRFYETIVIGSGSRSYFGSGQNYADFGINWFLGNGIEPGLETYALGFYIRSRFKGYTVGYSYDLALNGLSLPGERVGTFEFSLGYIFGRNPNVKRVIPRF